MTSPDALAKSPKTFLDRDNWMRAVLAADLPDAAVRVAMTIALHLRVNTGRCNPSYPTVAADSHVSERSTYRLVDLLEHRGWIAITRTSGYGNQYTLATPDKAMAGVQDTHSCHNYGRGTPDSIGRSTPANMLAGEKRSNRTKKEREEARSRPHVGSRVSKRSPAKARPKANSEIGDSFERFWAVYPRKVNEDDARAAFAKAIKTGADIDTVVARAACYAVERADAIRNGDLPKMDAVRRHVAEKTQME